MSFKVKHVGHFDLFSTTLVLHPIYTALCIQFSLRFYRTFTKFIRHCPAVSTPLHLIHVHVHDYLYCTCTCTCTCYATCSWNNGLNLTYMYIVHVLYSQCMNMMQAKRFFAIQAKVMKIYLRSRWTWMTFYWLVIMYMYM